MKHYHRYPQVDRPVWNEVRDKVSKLISCIIKSNLSIIINLHSVSPNGFKFILLDYDHELLTRRTGFWRWKDHTILRLEAIFPICYSLRSPSQLFLSQERSTITVLAVFTVLATGNSSYSFSQINFWDIL